MLQALKLLLPALLPSWRFFDFIVASPRVQYALLDVDQQLITPWQEFRPRPPRLSSLTLLQRLFWNPAWNETLFVMSCAERIVAEPSPHPEAEIARRIVDSWRDGRLQGPDSALYAQFRLAFVARTGQVINDEIRFTSKLMPLPERT